MRGVDARRYLGYSFEENIVAERNYVKIFKTTSTFVLHDEWGIDIEIVLTGWQTEEIMGDREPGNVLQHRGYLQLLYHYFRSVEHLYYR